MLACRYTGFALQLTNVVISGSFHVYQGTSNGAFLCLKCSFYLPASASSHITRPVLKAFVQWPEEQAGYTGKEDDCGGGGSGSSPNKESHVGGTCRCELSSGGIKRTHRVLQKGNLGNSVRPPDLCCRPGREKYPQPLQSVSFLSPPAKSS